MPSLQRLIAVFCCSLLLCTGLARAQTRCNEEDADLSKSSRDSKMPSFGSDDPRSQMQQLVQRALTLSRPVGAARLMTDAARSDLAEARAAKLPTVSLGGTLGPLGSVVDGVKQPGGMQLQTNISASAPLWDAGRIEMLAKWRYELAESAVYSQKSTEEQLALQTISLAIDRSRYILTAQVYGQYVRKMACLVDALDVITKADKGRASELVQARKNFQQADLSYVSTLDSLKSTETRLKRLVGDDLPPAASMSALLTQVPDLDQTVADMKMSADVITADAQARAQRHYADSVIAGQKPQVSWLVNGGAAGGGAGRNTNWAAGVTVNVPILIPGSKDAANAAYRRADAADLQRDEAIESKRYRLIEMYDSANATLDRARRIVELLRDSERLRSATLQQWQQLGRRSLFDVMAAEGDYYSMRVAHVNTLADCQQLIALMWSMGKGVSAPLR